MRKFLRVTKSEFRIDSTSSPKKVDSLRTGNITRKPLSDQKGIHCEGNKLGYIVDWQVSEKKTNDIIVQW